MPSYVLIGLCEPLGDEDQAAFDEWFVDQHIEDTARSVQTSSVAEFTSWQVRIWAWKPSRATCLFMKLKRRVMKRLRKC